MVFIDIVLGLSIVGGISSYFPLFVRQIIGIFPDLEKHHVVTNICIYFFFLVFTGLLRYHRLSVHFLGVGIVSVICLVSFFVWVILDKPEGENRQKSLPAIGNNFIDLVAMLINAFEIHHVVSQILLDSSKPKRFKSILRNSFIVGGAINLLACFCCVGINQYVCRFNQ